MKIDKAFADEIKARIERVRTAIKTEELVAELQQCALGQKIMDREQIKAAEILLKKSLPDMKQIEHTGPDGGPVQYTVQVLKFADYNDSETVAPASLPAATVAISGAGREEI